MADTIFQIPQQSVKELAKSHNLTSIPTNYAYFADNSTPSSVVDSELCDSIPVIDFSLLKSGTPDQRSQIIQDLRNACQDWGFFMVVNHGVAESLIEGMMDKCKEFFNLTAEEKREFEGNHVLDPIRCGTSFNTSAEKVNFWRDFLKVTVHPHFHSPTKPLGFSEVSSEYCKEIRRVARALLRGISTSLGLEELEIERSMDLESGLQILAANLYPPCPQPDLAIGMPPHSDYGLLAFLAQNQVGGLQIQHHGKWIPVNPLPNSFLVNTCDHLEIFSNGKYKSVLHRATLNSKATRISLAIANGPSLDTVVSPPIKLLCGEQCAPILYKPMLYKEYLELQQTNRLNCKSGLGIVQV